MERVTEKLRALNIQVECFTEPVTEWNKYNLLSNATRFPSVFAFPLQSLILCTLFKQRAQTARGASKPGVTLYERSIETGQKVFLELYKEKKKITECESNILTQLYEILTKTNKIPKSDLVIYLRATPEICLRNVQKRGEESDSEISVKYLEDISKQYERYMEENVQKKKIIMIDREQDDLEKICEEVSKLIALKLFINSGVDVYNQAP